MAGRSMLSNIANGAAVKFLLLQMFSRVVLASPNLYNHCFFHSNYFKQHETHCLDKHVTEY